MRPQLRLSRVVLGLALAAGALWLTPSPARAQFTYGYNSIVTYPASPSFWYNVGYSGVYTDTSNGVYTGAAAPYRRVAPYVEPPYGQFPRSNGLTTAPYARPNPVTTAPARPVAVQRRRGLLGRLRGR